MNKKLKVVIIIKIEYYHKEIVNVKGLELIFASHYFEKSCKLGNERSCIAFKGVADRLAKK